MIVHVFNSSVVSGPETLVIPALPRLGEDVTVVFLSETRLGDRSAGPPAYAKSFGINVIEVPVRSRWDRDAVAGLRAILDRLSPRVVHAHEVKASAYVAAARRRGGTTFYVTTNHGVRAKKAPVLRAYEWIYTHAVMRAFDRVLCVCTSDLEILAKRRVPREKLRVHLNGVDRPRVDPARRDEESARIRRAWGLADRGVSEHAICLGLVGRLAPEKRHSYIMRALKELVHQRMDLDVHLLVFGTGAMEEQLAAESRSLGLMRRVHWMGYRGTVGAETAGFDLLVSLSFAEGLPINIVEAGWAATPVFATNVDGNRDLVPDSEHGTLIEVEASEREAADRLASLLSDRAALARTGARLQRRIEDQFSGKVWVERLLAIYRGQ